MFSLIIKNLNIKVRLKELKSIKRPIKPNDKVSKKKKKLDFSQRKQLTRKKKPLTIQ